MKTNAIVEDPSCNALGAELIASPQFDAGRWKLRMERIPVPTHDRPVESSAWSIAVGLTMLSPLLFLAAVYLWAQMAG